jgi:hypothetical protein
MAFENQDSIQIVTPQQVVNRMGLDNSGGQYTAVMTSAIAAAQLHTEVAWESRFTDPGSGAEPNGLTEIFKLNPLEFGIQPDGFYRCLLSRGFINDRVPFVVQIADDWPSAANQTGLIQTLNIQQDASLFMLDPVRGILSIPVSFGVPLSPFPPFGDAGAGWTNHGKWVVVTYSSGFDSTTLAQVPDWVTEAIVSYCPVIYDVGQPTNRSQEAEQQFKKAAAHSNTILAPYKRNIGFCASSIVKQF